MTKKRTKNISKHIKTRHKKAHFDRKLAYTKVDSSLKDINQIITK